MAFRTVRWFLILLGVAAILLMPVMPSAAESVVVLVAGGAQLRLNRDTVESARLVEGPAGRISVEIELVPTAVRALEKLTEANVDRPIHFRSAGRTFMSLIVSEPIHDGAVELIGLDPEEAAAIVRELE